MSKNARFYVFFDVLVEALKQDISAELITNYVNYTPKLVLKRLNDIT